MTSVGGANVFLQKSEQKKQLYPSIAVDAFSSRNSCSFRITALSCSKKQFSLLRFFFFTPTYDFRSQAESFSVKSYLSTLNERCLSVLFFLQSVISRRVQISCGKTDEEMITSWRSSLYYRLGWEIEALRSDDSFSLLEHVFATQMHILRVLPLQR